jgi:hypothetical protein
MPSYVALTYTADVDWSAPEQAEEMAAYAEFGRAAAAVIRGGNDGEVVTSDGPYAETKEVLSGFYTLECADLDEAIALAARIPAAWSGAVEVRPVLEYEAGAAGA